MPKEPSIERLMDLARGRLPADEAAALRDEWPEAIETITRTIEVLDADARDLPPEGAVARAKSLGARLGALRPASLAERIGEAVARLVRDTRLDAAVAGLRGNAGFACAFAAGGTEIEFECTGDRSGGFRVTGQVSGEGWASLEFVAIADGISTVTTVDGDGMFTAAVPTGSYVITARSRDGRSIRIDDFEIP